MSPETAALQQQIAALEQRLKLLSDERKTDRSDVLDPVSIQNELVEQRFRLAAQERNIAKLAGPRQDLLKWDTAARAKDDTPIESVRSAYTSLAGIAPDVAKALTCAGKNIVLFSPAQSDSLLHLAAFKDQVGVLRARLRSVLDIQAPVAPDKDASAGVYGVSALSRPVLQSVLDLVALFRGGVEPRTDSAVDEAGVIAAIANAAVAQGCEVYWPDQYVSKPFDARSQISADLQSISELNDNAGMSGRPAGLQQRLHAIRVELNRAEQLEQVRAHAIERERFKLSEAEKKVDAIRTQITFIASNIKDQKNAAMQDKLNRAFDKSWDELDQAVKRQLASHLPGTLEEQGKLGEMSKRLDLLKARTDWLSQYVKDEKDIALQDKLKRTLSATWDQLDAALKDAQALRVSVPQAIEPEEKERRRWAKYSAELKELVGTLTAASEAYVTFRSALLDGSSGQSPLSRIVRAEALRNLIFDDKLQERPGSSVVQVNLQRLTGTQLLKAGTDEKKMFSGGVILSFVQYEPNGKIRNSGVHTAYVPFK